MKKLTALLLLLPVLASADRSDPIQYLKNEPASMLDFGIKAAQDYFRDAEDSIRQDIALNNPGKAIFSVWTQVTYDTKSDLIVVLTRITTPHLLSDLTCRDVRTGQAGLLRLGLTTSRLFSHADDEIGNTQTLPEDAPPGVTTFQWSQFQLDLRARFELQCQIIQGLRTTHHIKQVGSGPLISLMEDD